jgi:tetratricopeptide (TPR) repeat protein
MAPPVGNAPSIEVFMPLPAHRRALALWALFFLPLSCAASEAKKAAEEGARLYERGDYQAAQPLLEKAVQKGVKDGETFYQLAYLYNLQNSPDKAREYQAKAEPLLAKRASSDKATVKDSYYLTALYASLQRGADMKQAAQEGIKKFGNRTDLAGEDLFRLGRLYQFAGDGAGAASSYHKAAEAMGRDPNANPILYALALTSDASTDLLSRRYAEAAAKLEKAATVNPKAPPPAYQRALVQLGAGNYADAAQRFAEVRDEATSTEAQYGADVARRLEAAGGRLEKTPDGKPFLEMDNTALDAALTEAARSFREAKSAEKPDPEKLRGTEQLFFSLAAEWMLRGNSLRESSLGGNYADLIRR